MKIKSLSIILAAALSLPLCAYEIGAKDAVIFHSKKSASSARELRTFLNKVFGKKYTLKLYKNSDAPGIYVGIPAKGVKVDHPIEKEYCVLHSEKERLFIYGNDDKKLTGTDFAVSDFLQKYCGVRFLWPGKIGTVADRRKPVTIKEGTEIYAPPFDLRLTNSFHYGKAYLNAAEKADLDNWLRHHKVGRSIYAVSSGFQHSFDRMLPRDEYGKKHPEYYSLVAPERWVGEPKPKVPTRRNDPFYSGTWQVCTSNPEVRKIFAEKVAAPKDGKIRSISPNDGYGFCECENCLKQDLGRELFPNGQLKVTNRMYHFAEDIAKQVYKLNPKAKVGMFAYGAYYGVPKQKVTFPPNMYLSFCYLVYDMDDKEQDELEGILSGLAATGAKIIGREYWGCHYTMGYPLNHSRKIDRNLKMLHKLNAAGIYGGAGNDFANRASDLYILARLSWDPTLKREDLLKDFCDSAFGPKASPVMYEMFEKIENLTTEAFVKNKTQKGVNAQYYKKPYAETVRMLSHLYDKEFIDMCSKYLARAKKLAATAEQRARIDYINSGLQFTKVQTAALKSYQKLAAIGIDMPLTQPDAENFPMKKSTIAAIITEANEASAQREKAWTTLSDNNNFSRSRRSDALNLRPWAVMAQAAQLQLRSGRYNYLVNNAFEYYGYSWDVKGDGQYEFVCNENCDADNNYMTQCHDGQGVSLKLNIPAGKSMTVTQKRPVFAEEGKTLAKFQMAVRCEGNPSQYVKVFLNDIELTPYQVDMLQKSDSDLWCQQAFRPVILKDGQYTLKIVVKNSDSKPLTINFDATSLRLTKAI